MRLSTTCIGDGPRRIGLIHGLGADSTTWEPFIDQLLAVGGVTVFAPDLRGHGKSDRADSYTVAAFAEDLVDSLPQGLDAVVGHSLGGAVLVSAVSRLRPRHAVYLDPGFNLGLPTTGLGGRLFWATAPLSLGIAALWTARRNAAGRTTYPERGQQLTKQAQARFDKRMTSAVFRDIAFHAVPVAAPEVPSTIVLSGDSAAVLPDVLAHQLAGVGWEIRRLPELRHDMQLQDPAATFAMIRDVLIG